MLYVLWVAAVCCGAIACCLGWFWWYWCVVCVLLCFLWLGSIWVCLFVSGFWRLTGAYRGLVVLDAALCVACF